MPCQASFVFPATLQLVAALTVPAASFFQKKKTFNKKWCCFKGRLPSAVRKPLGRAGPGDGRVVSGRVSGSAFAWAQVGGVGRTNHIVVLHVVVTGLLVLLQRDAVKGEAARVDAQALGQDRAGVG